MKPARLPLLVARLAPSRAACLAPSRAARLAPSRAARLASLVACLALAACAPVYGDAFLSAYAAGARAYHAGRYAEAASAYGDASGKALRVKDRDEARFLQARCLEKAGQYAEAEATYVRLVADSPTGPRTGRAAFERAEVEIRHGDEERGFAWLAEAARRNPQHGVTRPAIHRVAEHLGKTRGEPAALAWLKEQVPAFRGTDQDQVVAYEIALTLGRMDRKEESHDALLAAAAVRPYPFGGLTDDALFHAAQIDEELGRYAEAVKHLRDLLAVHEISRPIIGDFDMASYERPRFPEAQLEIAEIYRDKLGDRAAARREFEKAYREHPTARKRDLAVWSGAVLAKQDGDLAAACDLAERLVRELPESRYAPCAREVCPRLPPGKRACADYILRELAGEKREPDEP